MGWVRALPRRNRVGSGSAAWSGPGACPPWGRETGSLPAVRGVQLTGGQPAARVVRGLCSVFQLSEETNSRHGDLDFPPRGAPPLSCLCSLHLSWFVSVLGSEASWAQSQREFVLEATGKLVPHFLKSLLGLIKTVQRESTLDTAEEAQPGVVPDSFHCGHPLWKESCLHLEPLSLKSNLRFPDVFSLPL